jgi:uncharacterized alkaline shock family protein YloU
MEAQPLISHDVLARYAGDAASEVAGGSLAESPLHRGRAVEVTESEDAIGITVHVELDWGRSASEVCSQVQSRVREYLERMTNARVENVDVVVQRVGATPAPR